MKLTTTFALLITTAHFAPSLATQKPKHSLRGSNPKNQQNQDLTVVYPECYETNPSSSVLAGAFDSDIEAYRYCKYECRNDVSVCLDWMSAYPMPVYPECDETNPSGDVLAGVFDSASEAYNYCIGECRKDDAICQVWQDNYPETRKLSVVYPECYETNPSSSVLAGAFDSDIEAYRYCKYECRNDVSVCLDWMSAYPMPVYPECDETNPSGDVLAGVFDSASEAYNYCIGECRKHDAICQVWQDNYP
ncbi:unknown protein [Seminavis robusta]|uniref:Uncharacterized protein n=1 Tax=Seminavis robusta TaxID=568900 RepID=A0A9N8HDD9_9STRA|nr:unknown protein [Seminavis robusta]|eukprot:Sro356_g125290.1 n/a (248) ;mRNA; f:21676-22419